LQQLRQTFDPDDPYRFLLHDRDSIFSEGLDRSIAAFGLRVLKSPPRSPKANALCERLIGTIRRECLDWLIPLSEHHLRSLLKVWAVHYNRSRPHMGLGPGIPDPPEHRILPTDSACIWHQLGGFARLRVKSILGGLHDEYDWAPACI
jgi:transposase InsO family protein